MAQPVIDSQWAGWSPSPTSTGVTVATYPVTPGLGDGSQAKLRPCTVGVAVTSAGGATRTSALAPPSPQPPPSSSYWTAYVRGGTSVSSHEPPAVAVPGHSMVVGPFSRNPTAA